MYIYCYIFRQNCTAILSYFKILLYINYRGSTVVKALCYKLEGRWFDPSWCYWNFSLT